MTRAISVATFLSLAVVVGCADAGEAARDEAPVRAAADEKPGRVAGLEAGWELMPAGVATVTASQTPGEVIVRANGELPGANWEAKLFVSPLRIWPPQYLLARRKTGDFGAQVITPFDVLAVFKADQLIREVTVRDAAGPRKVKVDQARD